MFNGRVDRAAQPMGNACHLSLASPGVGFDGLNASGFERVDALLGCGALQRLDDAHVEVKAMRTSRAHLRRGVGKTVLAHLLYEARAAGYARASLETGSMDYFAPARRMYADAGFIECAPFADYVDDPNSTYMTRAL